jgi:hypothetical protein
MDLGKVRQSAIQFGSSVSKSVTLIYFYRCYTPRKFIFLQIYLKPDNDLQRDWRLFSDNRRRMVFCPRSRRKVEVRVHQSVRH